MKKVIVIEEIGLFLLALFGFYYLPFSWWVFPVLLLTPDLGMIGYAINPKIGAVIYNIVHHKALAIAFFMVGFYLSSSTLYLRALFYLHTPVWIGL